MTGWGTEFGGYRMPLRVIRCTQRNTAELELSAPPIRVATFSYTPRQPFLTEVSMRRIGLAVVFVLGLTLAPLAGDAQQAAKIPRVGLLRPGSPPDPYVDAFRQGLRELGYVEDQSIAIEYRWAEGRSARVPLLAAELVQLKVDVIVTQGEAAVHAVKEASSAIPIVMAVVGDPVEAGLVASLGRPGGNVTGLSATAPDLTGKQLQLLKEAVPKVSRVAVLSNTTFLAVVLGLKEARGAARALGLTVQPVEVRAPDDLGPAFDAMTKGRADALLAFGDPSTIANQGRILDLAAKRRLPTTCNWLESGACLISYGPNRLDMFRRAATYVDISKHAGRVKSERVLG
jgi:putative tryptophan/tyrosine transport system substrate-binding protein